MRLFTMAGAHDFVAAAMGAGLPGAGRTGAGMTGAARAGAALAGAALGWLGAAAAGAELAGATAAGVAALVGSALPAAVAGAGVGAGAGAGAAVFFTDSVLAGVLVPFFTPNALPGVAEEELDEGWALAALDTEAAELLLPLEVVLPRLALNVIWAEVKKVSIPRADKGEQGPS